jgi:hypothetical protein|tara:strand:+ start:266 stop:475 length:210 start_codon:yes stop_codon:yes gene_type:complete
MDYRDIIKDYMDERRPNPISIRNLKKITNMKSGRILRYMNNCNLYERAYPREVGSAMHRDRLHIYKFKN